MNRASDTLQVSLSKVHCYNLKKQHLFDSCKGNSILEVLKDVFALHATNPQTPYLSLFARLRSFRKDSFDRLMYEDKKLVRVKGMRGTYFIIKVEDFPLVYQATRENNAKLKVLKNWGIREKEYCKVSEKIFEVLQEDGKTLQEIKRVLPARLKRTVQRIVGRRKYSATNLSVILNILEIEGKIVSYKGKGTWSPLHPNKYFLTQKLFPSINLHSISKDEAKEQLIQRYITAFGPVSTRDITWWTGFKASVVKKLLQERSDKFCRLEIDELKGIFWMAHKEVKELMATEKPEEVSLELLPYEDLYLKGYKDRRRFVEAENEHIFYYNGSSAAPSILFNNRLVGVWNYGLSRKEKITFKLITNLGENVLRLLIKQIKRTGEFLDTLRG
jgi:uncharacterized protein YcaQ